MVTGFTVEPVDDALAFQGEVDGPPDVVQSRGVEATAPQVAVTDRADALDAEVICGRVELALELGDDSEPL